jgi:hypothetical protein
MVIFCYNEVITVIYYLTFLGIMRGNEDVGANPELEAGRNNRLRLIRTKFQNEQFGLTCTL